MYPEPEPDRDDGDRLSAIAIGKSLAFVLYSYPLALVTVIATDFFLGGWLTDTNRLPVFLGTLSLAGLALLGVVIAGVLPGTDGRHAKPFSERQAALVIQVASLLPWVFEYDPVIRYWFSWILNGTLVFVVLTFFVVKSVLSRSPRFEVLLTLVLPAFQVYVSTALGTNSVLAIFGLTGQL